jgi:hypothetical protein
MSLRNIIERTRAEVGLMILIVVIQIPQVYNLEDPLKTIIMLLLSLFLITTYNISVVIKNRKNSTSDEWDSIDYFEP